jgi:hypothetical protein
VPEHDAFGRRIDEDPLAALRGACDRIDLAERLVRRAAARTDHAPANIDYLVLGAGPGLPWGAYFKDGTIVQGDARGRPRRVL